jgi:AraC-like DNA-binding protein
MLAHVVDYIKKNIRENLQLEGLAAQACMSKAHFLRVFKIELGLTPMEFVMKERLKLTKNYLLMGDFQVLEVSLVWGFNDLTNFIRVFKREFQVTPKVF